MANDPELEARSCTFQYIHWEVGVKFMVPIYPSQNQDWKFLERGDGFLLTSCLGYLDLAAFVFLVPILRPEVLFSFQDGLAS